MNQRQKIVIPNLPERKLTQTANDWQRSQTRDEVLSALNRLTPENLDVVAQQMVQLLTNRKKKEEFVKRISTKAYAEPKFSNT